MLPQASVRKMFARLKKRNPNPRSELIYRSKFELLVAVMLSAQATDVSVNKATRTLFKAANTPGKMLKLGKRKLKSHIKTIGLFNAKTDNILATCKILLDEHGGRVPGDRDALTRLPGVGRKTANVILNNAFGQPTIAVDTHIFRVSNRTGLAPGKTPDAVEKKLLRAVPDSFKQHAHHWLILHGRYTCKARNPECGDCPIADLCIWQDKHTIASTD